MKDLYPILKELEKKQVVPRLTAYNRIDGPGSSLDLREFQQCLWLDTGKIIEESDDLSRSWSKVLPRTVGISINLGCVAEAYPLENGKIGVESHDYGTEHIFKPGEIPYRQEYWLVKALELFGLKGVKIVLHNLVPGIQSSGLGGSATAITAVCLLANKLADNLFSPDQIIAMASILEQDMGISITGTQEQSNVVYGGVKDYIWFPWGIPGESGSYGSSIRDVLLDEKDYFELENRMKLYHSGKPRASTDVNKVWRNKLKTTDGLMLHRKKLGIAYEYREGIRLKDWDRVNRSIKEYRQLRITLCKEYMSDTCWEIQGQCERFSAESFPLGAGGGGVVLVFCPYPEEFQNLQLTLDKAYRKINFNICSSGHSFKSIP